MQVMTSGRRVLFKNTYGGCHDAEHQQLVGAIFLRSLEGPRASNATDQSVLGRNRWPGLWTGHCS